MAQTDSTSGTGQNESRRRVTRTDIVLGWNGGSAVTQAVPDNVGLAQHQIWWNSSGATAGTMTVWVRPAKSNFFVPVSTINIVANPNSCIFLAAIIDDVQLTMSGLSGTLTLAAAISSVGISFTPTGNRSLVDRRRFQVMEVATGWNGAAAITSSAPDHAGYAQHQFAIAGGVGTVNILGRPVGGNTYVNINTDTINIPASGAIVLFPGMYDAFQIVPNGGLTGSINAEVISIGEEMFLPVTPWQMVNGLPTALGLTLTPTIIGTALGYTPANDALVVHIAGTETITGAKTFSAQATFTASNAIEVSPASGVQANITLNGTANDTAIILNKIPTTGFNNYVVGRTNGNNRWIMDLGESTNESGSNAGSNFFLTACNDAGTAISTPFSIIRSTGVSTFSSASGFNLPWTVLISNAGNQGAGLKLLGDGVTTPSKTIRARIGVLEFINDAFSIITTMSDAGNWSMQGLTCLGINCTGFQQLSAGAASDLFIGFSSSVAGRQYFEANSTGLTINCTDGAGSFKSTYLTGFTATGTIRLGGGTAVNGNLTPATDNAFTCGGAANRWTTVFAVTGAINTSDARDKTSVTPLTTNEIAAAKDLIEMVGTYQFLQSIADKSEDDARSHVGLTVQSAMDVMTKHGLDPNKYGFICYDKWDASNDVIQPEMTDPATGATIPEILENKPAGDKYGFRTDELLFFMARGMEARIAALEALVPPPTPTTQVTQ